MKTLLTLFTALLTLAASTPTSPAEKSKTPDKASKIKAITPEVQTAKWAVKWWMPRHKQKIADLAKKKRVDLLMIGDSITHGWEGRGKATWQKYYAQRNAFNIGFSGDRTENVLWRLQNGAISGISPKLAVLMIGTNNAGHRREKSQHTALGIKTILKELKKRLPKTKILVLAIFPRGAKPNDHLRKLNVATNKIIAKYADNKSIFFLDINPVFLDRNGDLPKSIMPDRLHPNQKGYEIWAKAMEPTIKRLMADSR